MEVKPKQPSVRGPGQWFTGDAVVTPPDEWHWHGAAAERFMTHLSITEGGAEWGDHVTDDEYPG